MSTDEPADISRTMTQLLRRRSGAGRLPLDDGGWAELIDLCAALTQAVEIEITEQTVVQVVETQRRRFELSATQTRIRAIGDQRHRPNPRRYVKATPPDILFVATNREAVGRFRRAGRVFPRRGHQQIKLHATESRAWCAAHRMPTAQPAVLYVDASRARRSGTRFWRNRRTGDWVSSPIDVRHVLNLRRNFQVQLSAGGLPVSVGPDGLPRLALIQVTRRSGVTWEVAKGKLEPGEPPEIAAVREVCEEMGVDVELSVLRTLGTARYGFLAPGGAPRLKTMFMYLLQPAGPMDDFCPSTREGIGAVRWFTPDEAVAAVTHSSLQPVMAEARELLVADDWRTLLHH